MRTQDTETLDTPRHVKARDVRSAPEAFEAWLFIAAAPVILVLAFTAFLALPATREAALLLVHEETSIRERYPVEILTFLLSLLAGAVGIWLCLRYAHPLGELIFFAIFSAGMVFIAMEEVAWGQWLFKYATPEWMEEVNRQGEMTMHNVGALQGKSELFRLAFGVGGLLALLLPLRMIDRIRVPWSLASALIIITAFSALDTIGDVGLLSRRADFYFARMSEIVELLIAYVGLTYLILHLRCRRAWRLRRTLGR